MYGPIGPALSDETRGWLRYVAWSAFAAVVTTLTTKVTEKLFEKTKPKEDAK